MTYGKYFVPQSEGRATGQGLRSERVGPHQIEKPGEPSAVPGGKRGVRERRLARLFREAGVADLERGQREAPSGREQVVRLGERLLIAGDGTVERARHELPARGLLRCGAGS